MSTCVALAAGDFYKGETQLYWFVAKKPWKQKWKAIKHLIDTQVTVTGWYLSWKKLPDMIMGEATFEPVWSAAIKEHEQLIPQEDLRPCF